MIYKTSKIWSGGKKTYLEFERFQIRVPLMLLEGGKCI